MNKNIDINIVLLNKKAKIPVKQHNKDIGYDIFSSKSYQILPRKITFIETGFSIELPDGCGGFILPRSGLASKNNISVLNTPGTIDSDYRGELKIILFNHGENEFIVNNQDRVAQMVLAPIIKATFEEVEELPETIRGEGGIGSKGK